MSKLAELHVWSLAALYVVGSALGALVAQRSIRRGLAEARERMDPKINTVLMRSLPRPTAAAVFLLALSIGLHLVELPPSVETFMKHVLPLILGALAVIVLMRVALSGITAYGETVPQLKSTAGIGRAITWIFGLALIALLISDAAGISLAPAVTALGVGSLSVALALQDTLSNFFAGIYLLLDRPIRPGDFVRLDAMNEGYVEEIGWRSTKFRTLAPSVFIVPNATLSKATITNFGQTNPRLLLSAPIDVSLEADPEAVTPILEEVVKRSVEIAGVDAAQAPFLRFTMGDRGFTFTFYVFVIPAADGGLVLQELRKRAIVRLRRDGVRLADPNPFAAKR